MSTSTTATTEGPGPKPADVVVHGNASGFLQEIVSGAHQLHADEPVDVGGGDARLGRTIIYLPDWGLAHR